MCGDKRFAKDNIDHICSHYKNNEYNIIVFGIFEFRILMSITINKYELLRTYDMLTRNIHPEPMGVL